MPSHPGDLWDRYMWVLNIEIASCHPLGTYYFEVDFTFLETLCTCGVMYGVASQSVKYINIFTVLITI